MTTTLAAVQAETFNFAAVHNWTLAPAVFSAEVLLWAAGFGAWCLGVAWIGLLPRWRRSRTRFAVGLAALGGILLSVCATPAVVVAKRADPAWAALVLAVPAASIAVAAWGIAWIAFRWRIEDPTRCGRCGHPLLAAQASCPECGDPRARPWGARQARVFARTLLAIACACASLLAVVGIGALPLEWKARLVVDITDQREIRVAFIVAEATAVVRAAAPNSQEPYGPDGIIRSIESAEAWKSGPGVRTMHRVLPPEDPDVLDSFVPEARAAIASWIETARARCAGEPMDFIDEVAVVDTFLEVRRPPAWATSAAVAAGPCAALGLWFPARGRVRRRS